MCTVKYCRTCGLADPTHTVCQLRRIQIDPDKDFCSSHMTEVPVCAVCGRKFVGGGYLEQLEDGSFIEMCQACNDAMGTCRTCQYATECAYRDGNVHPELPLAVMAEVRQGNAILRKQVMNPERIEATCKAGCKCFLADGGFCCKADDGTCGQYTRIPITNK